MLSSKIIAVVCSLTTILSCSPANREVVTSALRAPAYPLVTIDPYTSVWSATDNLYDSPTIHWTEKKMPLTGILTVDGEEYRFMGAAGTEYEVICPDGSEKPWPARSTTKRPSGPWMMPDYDDSGWEESAGSFGHPRYGTATDWTCGDIWVRREVDLGESLEGKKVVLVRTARDDSEYYFNGVPVYSTKRTNEDKVVVLSEDAVALLKPGKNIIAVHCINYTKRHHLDFALYTEHECPEKYPQTALQTSVQVQATQTHYSFNAGPVTMKLIFSAPLFLDDLDLVSRPVNYISFEIMSTDGLKHNVSVKIEASKYLAVNNVSQSVDSEVFDKDGLTYLKIGNKVQKYLWRAEDDVRIDWGYFYLSSDGAEANAEDMSVEKRLGRVKETKGKFLIGYDDIYSIQFFGKNYRPYWNTSGDRTIFDMFSEAYREYDNLIDRCHEFDADLMRKAISAGGEKYAELCALAYRQAITSHKLIKTENGELMFFSKENGSNGSIGTVDITYPTSPLFLLYNPVLVQALMNPVFYYSESGKWTQPFAAHDVGTYPRANGQTYGNHMPVEESGNMIITTAAVCRYMNSVEYALKHWDTLTVWAEYLMKHGLDPDTQLCTDDFAGHLAHNSNLSIKAIIAIAAYGQMAENIGMEDEALRFMTAARDMAAKWMGMAADGNHYSLTFDKKGTWSQKYNLVWDKVLDLNVFDDVIRETEISFYKTKINEWGLPLDSRQTYTKADWILWTATMTDNMDDFRLFVDPVWKYMNETPGRQPMTDFFFTDRPESPEFKARPVVGGYFFPLLVHERE